ncbi:hypothetical protein D3C76_1064920 [compost metagenome]
MGDHGAGQCADQGADDGVHPLPGVEQLAAVKGEAGGGRAKGRTEFVGAQYQVRWQASGQQGRGGQQPAAAGDGVDETGNESDKGEDRQGGKVNAEFERHGIGLIGGGQQRAAGKGRYLTHIQLLLRPR